ncbi:cation diffusion facilitator family transporter [Candidatus Bipolaricaulota sp. J31]
MVFAEAGERISVIGALVNVGLIALKFAVGAAVGSVALIADGVHSFSDLLTDMVVIIGMRLGRRPPDDSHPYGHGKFETLAGAFVATLLILVGVELGRRAFTALGQAGTAHLGLAMITVALVSLVSKEALYQATIKTADAVRSPALRANAWHHRSDALSSLAVLLGGLGTSLGFHAGDGLAGMAVGAIIVVSGGKLLWDSLHELVEGRLLHQEERAIISAIEGVPGVRGWHRLRSRRSGRVSFVDVHITVDPEIPLREAHEIASRVEKAVEAVLGGEVSVTVHVEPKEEE